MLLLIPHRVFICQVINEETTIVGMGWRINHVPYMCISWVTSLLAPKTTIVQTTKLIYNLMLPNLV